MININKIYALCEMRQNRVVLFIQTLWNLRLDMIRVEYKHKEIFHCDTL